jgi:hypothetical protein
MCIFKKLILHYNIQILIFSKYSRFNIMKQFFILRPLKNNKKSCFYLENLIFVKFNIFFNIFNQILIIKLYCLFIKIGIKDINLFKDYLIIIKFIR